MRCGLGRGMAALNGTSMRVKDVRQLRHVPYVSVVLKANY